MSKIPWPTGNGRSAEMEKVNAFALQARECEMKALAKEIKNICYLITELELDEVRMA